MKQRKIKLFLIFLICSGLAWFVSKLSDTYTNSSTFDLTFKNLPDSVLIEKVSMNKINVKLRATGFQFLGFNLKKKGVVLDASKIKKDGTKFFIPNDICRRQIEKQLPGSMTLLDLDGEDIYFDLYKILTKEVPIKARVHLSPSQNYMIDGKVAIQPNIVKIHGPKEEIDTINEIRTEKLDLSGLTSNFTKNLRLDLPKGLDNTSFSVNSAIIKGKIFRFSERLIEVPVKVLNLPPGLRIRTFPDKVAVLCKSKIEDLKSFESSDFSVIADYNSLKGEKSSILPLQLQEKPEKLHSAILQETHVEFILKQE